MKPALSVILFTTLAGAGYGLWMWLGLRLAFGPRADPFEPITWAAVLLVGMALSCAGIVASLWHLGKPLRVWRAFSQWRSSWMSREGVMAVVALLVAVALLPVLGAHGGLPMRVLGGLLALVSAGTVATTAMIYASLKPIPAWRHPLVVPVYVVFALLVGGLGWLTLVFDARYWMPGMRYALIALALAAAAMKLAYWRAIEAPLPLTRGDAVGLPQRKVTSFERPHTEANYITREMGFAMLRRHARVMQLLALVLFCIVPLAVLLVAPAMPTALGVATASALAGSVLERWLFFAQARHMVTLYY